VKITQPSKTVAGNGASVETGETIPQRKARAAKILKKLEQTYGPVTCALVHESALQLLVSTILSAQSTDENVNRVTPGLWAKYPSAQAFAEAPIEELENDIRSTGFFRQKAKNIKSACQIIVEQFGGEVPSSMADLITLPGVARKTANVVLGTWFDRNDGVVVDTHVGRLAQRLGLTWTSKNDKDAVKIENDLMQIIPQEQWTYLSHALITHGRNICTARKPKCPECPVEKLCPSAGLV
jgi:endonuclease-3